MIYFDISDSRVDFLSVDYLQRRTDVKFADVLACINVSDMHGSGRQGPGVLDVIATEAGGGWVVGESVMGHWSRFSGHASPLSTYCH